MRKRAGKETGESGQRLNAHADGSTPPTSHLAGSGDDAARLDDVVAAELDYILHHRHFGRQRRVVERSLVGLALSGGGIRSATTNLGVLQALSRMNLLPMIDYVSTVSGGGYIGACLSSLLSDRQQSAVQDPDRCRPSMYTVPEAPSFTAGWKDFPLRAEYEGRRRVVGAELVAHLRTHGNFLIARWGLLRRETMRSIGNLLTGITYSVLLFLLTLFTASALYLTLAWFLAPGLLNSLDRTAASAQAAAVAPPSGDPDSTTTRGLSLLGKIKHNAVLAGGPLLRTEAAEGTGERRRPWWPLLVALIVGAVFALLTLGLFHPLKKYLGGARAGRRLSLDAGESAEDVFERLVLVSLAVGMLLVAAGTLAWFLMGKAPETGADDFVWLLVPFAVVAGARWASLLLAIFLLPYMGLWTRRSRSLWGGFQAITIFGWWITLVFALLPLLIYAVRDHTLSVGIGAAGSLILTRLLTSRAALTKRRFALPPGLRHAVLALAITAVIGLALLFFAVVLASLTSGARGTLPFFLWALAALGLLAFFVNPNRLSPHYFYQDRLAETYLLSEVADERGAMRLYRDAMEMPLRCLHGDYPGDSRSAPDPMSPPRNSAPYHLINAAINLAGSRDLTRKDRKSGYWLFSKLYCGSTHTNFRPTHTYNKGNTTVARAAAISGAAASSAIGQDTFFAQAFAMVLFNIRLGYWMDNPMYRGRRPAIWPWYLLREVLMNTIETSRLVNLSDGGHTGDNVGIYPLLQRRCKVIIACDAERDPALTFGSFTEALRHAYVDMGVAVDIDLTMLRQDPVTGKSRSHCAVGRIHYPDRPDQQSYLIYLKNSLTGDEPEPLVNYKSRCPAFPHETTADQFFDDAQFESYRALGVHLAEHTFGVWVRSTRWFPRARKHHGPAHAGPP